MNRLQGKITLITGAASGIGRAQALLFAREGAAVVAADLNADGAKQLVSEIEAAGGTALAVMMDVSDSDSVRAAVETAVARFGRIDILSNTAGAFDQYSQTLDTPRELWDKLIAVNLTSLYLVTNAVLPSMLASGGGKVVSIASGAGLVGGGGGAAYTSTKHAVIGYTRQLAAGYGKQGIRANAIAPGLIDTPMVADISHTDETTAWLANQPGGRLGRPEDIANAALFLVSDESDYIHGVTLPVDGGLINTL
jgi:3-oxoacyl-[acyl-carrier protein] reductase